MAIRTDTWTLVLSSSVPSYKHFLPWGFIKTVVLPVLRSLVLVTLQDKFWFRKKKPLISHLYVESKKAKCSKTRTVITKGSQVREMGECWLRSTKLQFCKMRNSKDWTSWKLHFNTILITRNLLRVHQVLALENKAFYVRSSVSLTDCFIVLI